MNPGISARRVRRTSGILLAAIAAGVSAAAPTRGFAQITWTGAAGDGSWSNPVNWNPGTVPGSAIAGDIADITTSGPSGVTVNYDYPNSVTLGDVVINLTGGTGGATNTLLMSANYLTSNYEDVGDSGAGGSNGNGMFTQNGGTNTVNTQLNIADNTTDTGIYNLGGSGSLNANFQIVGLGGAGSFNQNGGTNTIGSAGYNLCLGYDVGSSGTYNLNSGALNDMPSEYPEVVGIYGTGNFYQKEGTTNTVGSELELGLEAGSHGAYYLSGGVLSTNYVGLSTVLIGYAGTGTFTQTGGTFNVTGTSNIDIGYAPGGSGTYLLSAGSVNIGSGVVSGLNSNLVVGGSQTFGPGGQGLFKMSGTGSLYVANSIDVYPNSTFISTSSNPIVLGNNFSNESTQSTTFDLSQATVKLVGGYSHTFVWPGVDMGPTQAGYINNFAIGTLELASDGSTLNFDGPGALYVRTLLLDGYSGGSLSTFIADTISNNNGPSDLLNIYYDPSQAGNAYLDDQTYALGGGGVLEPVASALELTWNNTAGTIPSDGKTWDIINNNWNNGSAATVYADGDNVTFNDTNNATSNGGTNPSAYNVTLTTTISPGSVTVNNSLGNYTISGAGGKIVDTGAFTKSGSDTVTIGTALTVGSMSITAGAVKLASGVSGGAGPAVTSPINLTSLSITGSGQLDVNNNHLIITYGSSDPITTIAGYIKSGYNSGAWNGPGIMSTAAQTTTNGLLYGVGYADGADGVVAGLSSGQIEVAYTLLGDANLDGLVNGSDFNILAANFNQSITGWDQGDFNYDGLVNASDFNELAANFNQGVSGGASAGDVAALDAFAVANGLPLPTSNVPEPASAGMMVMAGLGILQRRRRL
jgi:hypothetical protein